MRTYHKINSLYKRDVKGNFTTEFSQREFLLLRNVPWIGTEKIDGTNIRIIWNGEKVELAGRTNKSDLPVHLVERLNEIIDRIDFKTVFGDSEAYLYGEGFGYKIQNGGEYIGREVDFILFDAQVNGVFLERQSVTEMARDFGIRHVPVLFTGLLSDAEKMVQRGFHSTIGYAQAEGLVLTPALELNDRRHKRIITKLKTKDYR